MTSFEDQVQKAIDAREIPGLVLLASDAKGTMFNPQTYYHKFTHLFRKFQIRESFRAKNTHRANGLERYFHSGISH